MTHEPVANPGPPPPLLTEGERIGLQSQHSSVVKARLELASLTIRRAEIEEALTQRVSAMRLMEAQAERDAQALMKKYGCSPEALWAASGLAAENGAA